MTINLELWKKRKKELHWSHDDLARESGVSRRTIAGIFAGDERGQNPTIETVQAIERALGLSEEGYKDTMPFEVTPTEEELITKYRSLSEENKKLFLILIKKIK